MSEEHLGILAHDSASEGIPLIWPKVMMFIPSSTNQLFKVVARVDVLVVGRKIVEDFGGSMNTCRSEANRRLAVRFLRAIHCEESAEFPHLLLKQDQSIPPKKTHSTMITAKISRLMDMVTALRATHLSAFFGRPSLSVS